MFWSFGSEKSAGVAIAIKTNDKISTKEVRKDGEGRVVSLLVEVSGVRFTLLCVYAPVDPCDRKVYLKKLPSYVYPGSHIILGGDFNCVLNDKDTSCVSGKNRIGQVELSAFLKDNGLVDIWEAFYRTVPTFTFVGPSGGSRLDRFYLTKDLVRCLSSVVQRPSGFSDHDGVSFEIRLSGARVKERPLWKFNNSVLTDKDFVEPMRTWLTKEISHGITWDDWTGFKSKVKNRTKRYCIDKARKRKKRECVISNKIVSLKQSLARGNDVNDELTRCEDEFKELVSENLKGAQVRSRAKWIEEGEKPTRYFFSLCRSRHNSNRIDTLKNEENEEVSDQQGLLEVIEAFYSKLFSKEDVDLDAQDILLSNLVECLDEGGSENCEGDLNVDEVRAAMAGMTRDKTPGEDGLSLEFYLCFADLLSPVLTAFANECFTRGNFPIDCVRSVVRLVFKKNDRSDLKNWRPISLLNVDYKIIARALGGRLRGVINSVVSSDQTCGIPGRRIVENLNFIRDLLFDVDRLEISGVCLSLDQEKAFDRVDREFLWKVLGKMGFGNRFIRWIGTLYKNATCKVICNNALTKDITLERGIRQGCPLSPMLYVLVAECLSGLLRTSSLNGFLVPGSGGLSSVVTQYADDTTLLLRDLSSVEKALSLVDFYGRGTGAKLNREKSEAMWLGKWTERKDEPLGLKWVDKMKILGVWFGRNVGNVNWDGRIQKLEQALNLWKGRALSLKGRVLIVKTVALSKLDYVATVLEVPSAVVKQVVTLIWKFVWGGKIELVKRGTCMNHVREGGLGMIDFKTRCTALQVNSVLSLLRRGEGKAFAYLRYFVGSRIASLVSGMEHLRTNLLPCAGVLPKYYEDVLSSIRLCPVNVSCTVKSVYLSFVKSLYVEPRCRRYWEGCQSGIAWNDVWRGLERSKSENIIKEVRWRCIHRIVKTRYVLKVLWGYKVNSANCAVCGQVETLEHLFLECPRVFFVWQWVKRLLRPVVKDLRLDGLFIFLCNFDFGSQINVIVMFVIETVLYCIWTFRNRATFDNCVVHSDNIIQFCRSLIRKRLLVERLRLNDELFRETWCVGNVLADSNLKILL